MATLIPSPARKISDITPRNGVITLYGYGISVRVDRGHLLLDDGVGSQRRRGRFARVAHGLKRLVIIGNDGQVSLAAIRWLADQGASFIVMERDGSVLTTSSPARPLDARLRRAQALALASGAAVSISKVLIERKIAAQQKIASDVLNNQIASQEIGRYLPKLAKSESIDDIRIIEALAAKAYWASWKTVSITFPRKDLPRVPEHWLRFSSRLSPITHSPRLASTPVNAILNYLYALVEAESRLAAIALGLDPSIGFLHADAAYRDSLACDLMEPIRAEVDAFVLHWILREPLARDWFFEERNGNCRLMASLAARLSETASTWGRLVAPYAEWVTHALGNQKSNSRIAFETPTRLTRRRKSEGQGNIFVNEIDTIRPPKICRICAKEISKGKHCAACIPVASGERFTLTALQWHAMPKDSKKKKRAAKVLSDHAVAITWWDPSSLPSWLTEDFYLNQIQPKLKPIKVSEIAGILGVSKLYAGQIRAGKKRPHPRHWKALLDLGSPGHGYQTALSSYQNNEHEQVIISGS